MSVYNHHTLHITCDFKDCTKDTIFECFDDYGSEDDCTQQFKNSEWSEEEQDSGKVKYYCPKHKAKHPPNKEYECLFPDKCYMGFTEHHISECSYVTLSKERESHERQQTPISSTS